MQPDEYGVDESKQVLRPGAFRYLVTYSFLINKCLLHQYAFLYQFATILINSCPFLRVSSTAPLHLYSKENVFVPPILAKWLRPHQREGVQFIYECVMGMKNFDGNGCILAGK